MNVKRWFGAGVVAILTAVLPSAAFAQERQPAQARLAGVMITRVAPKSTAAVQGLAAGDVILAVNGNRVRSLEDLHEGLFLAGWVAELDVVDGATHRTDKVLVYPRQGRIGVEVQLIQPGNANRVRPAIWERPSPASESESVVHH